MSDNNRNNEDVLIATTATRLTCLANVKKKLTFETIDNNADMFDNIADMFDNIADAFDNISDTFDHIADMFDNSYTTSLTHPIMTTIAVLSTA